MTQGEAVRGHDDAYLNIDQITKVYSTPTGSVKALEETSIRQRPGEFLSIVGPSGCGKSTLLMIAAGLSAPSTGAVIAGGKTITAPRTDIGIVFQSHVLLEWRTVLGNIMLQAEAHKIEKGKASAAPGHS